MDSQWKKTKEGEVSLEKMTKEEVADKLLTRIFFPRRKMEEKTLTEE